LIRAPSYERKVPQERALELQDNPQLYKIRHSLAHVLAQAVKAKYPKVQLGFGPPTDTGFYYDFDFGDQHITLEELKDIEKMMKKIIAQRQKFQRSDFDADGALQRLKAAGVEAYKEENVRMLRERGESNFSFYENGGFVDLCEGPHVEHTGELPVDAFKLDRIAGAYWLGNENNKMLTRIYALAFQTRAELDEFLKRRAAAEEFDHKKLGKELEIFRTEDIVGKGLPLWLPNGTAVRDAIEKFAREKEFLYGYQRVVTPNITKADLFHRSQHLPAYRESMFPPFTFDDDGEKTEYYLKPMNCPFHHLIFASTTRSYRDLPLRLAEYGTVYRYEQSGELSGLLRVRCMCMNDAHIYIRPDQFLEEFKSVMQMYQEFYQTFRLKDYRYRLSVRGKENEHKFKGDAEMWTRGETLLKQGMDELGLDYFVGEGEAAFYGPKIDIQFKNLMGREETVSTVQVDFLSAQNFGLHYIDEHGQQVMPVIIHRSPLSTHERFMSFLLEYYGGAFPTWCAPVQVCLVPVGEEQIPYCRLLASELHAQFVRVEVDDSNNSFNKKIRNNTVRKIPIMLIVGNKEVEENKVTVRRYGTREQAVLGRGEFVEQLLAEIRERKMFREPMGSII
jgi:threonyl-tRNA synthetase